VCVPFALLLGCSASFCVRVLPEFTSGAAACKSHQRTHSAKAVEGNSQHTTDILTISHSTPILSGPAGAVLAIPQNNIAQY
jgi:hypothetical protein